MWKLKFNAPKGCREMKNCFAWVDVYTLSDEQNPMWHYENQKGFSEKGTGSYSSALIGINSVKSFKRFLRKHGDNLKGYEVRLQSKYYETDIQGNMKYDYSVTATWEEGGKDLL